MISLLGVDAPIRIRLTKETKHDMEVWLKFLREFNGRSFFLDDKCNTSPPHELYTDAAGSKGYGAIYGPHWFFGSFTDEWQSLNITFLELLLRWLTDVSCLLLITLR